MGHKIGIDLGGTSAKVALISDRHRIIRDESVPTSAHGKPAAVAKALALACRRVSQGKKIRSVGVGVAGDIDSTRGVVRISPNLGWRNVPLRRLLQMELRAEIVVENDANAAAWGIYKTQVPRGVRNVIVVTLGTGVGGGLIIDGKLHGGATGSAGEVGHMTIHPGGRRCNCGNLGCLEAYVGGVYLQRRTKMSPLELNQAAKRGDKFSRRVWEEVGEALGIALGNLIYVLNPEMIFLTGGVAQSKELILRPVWKVLKKRSFPTPIQAVDIRVAKEATHMGVIGASLL